MFSGISELFAKAVSLPVLNDHRRRELPWLMTWCLKPFLRREILLPSSWRDKQTPKYLPFLAKGMRIGDESESESENTELWNSVLGRPYNYCSTNQCRSFRHTFSVDAEHVLILFLYT